VSAKLDMPARIITEISTPAASVLAISILCGVRGTPGAAGFLWGAGLGLFCAVIPYATLEIASRRKIITDRHVTQKAQRPWAYGICLVSVLVGLLMMLLFDAPPLIRWAIITMVVALVIAAGVTAIGPKVSMHTMCITAFFVLASLLLSAWWLTGLVVALPLVAWSRLRLEHHSPYEVISGAVLGATVTATSWLLLPA